jgi:hypothetical protein
MGLDLLETMIDGFQMRRKKTEGKKRREKVTTQPQRIVVIIRLDGLNSCP